MKRERMKEMKPKYVFAAGTLTVFAGYFSGVLTVFFGGGAEDSYVSAYLSSTPSVRWLEAFLNGPGYLFLTLCCGVFLLGWFLVFPLIFYKAYGYGYTAGLFLAALGTKGLIPLGLCLFPPAVAECALLVCACKEVFPLSFSLFRGASKDFTKGLRPYLLHGLVLFQCSSFVLLWDLFLAPLLLEGVREML